VGVRLGFFTLAAAIHELMGGKIMKAVAIAMAAMMGLFFVSTEAVQA
jgi:hypothetical protein